MNTNGLLKKNIKANQLRFSSQVFVVGMILAITFFLLLVDTFKTYRSTITVLVNTKSEIAIKQKQQIVNNIIEFSRTLSFYERVLKYNPDVTDITEGNSPDKRKQIWNKMFSIEKVSGNESVLKISIETKRKTDADKLAQKTARSLFDVTGMYYDIRKDVDLRIIDGPIAQSEISDWYLLLFFSLLLGFLIAFFLQYVLSEGQKSFRGKNSLLKEKTFFNLKSETSSLAQEPLRSLEELYTTKQAETSFVINEKTETPIFQQEKPYKIKENTPQIREMKKLTKMIEQDKYPNFPEVPRYKKKKASAPDNLPISNDLFFSQNDMDREQQESDKDRRAPVEEKKTEIDLGREPTEEELKKRLNHLLRGNL